MNLCRPDDRKSCAACCGLYNVPDATRPHLLEKLLTRTTRFAAVGRSAEAIIEFAASVRQLEDEAPLDSAIHVCEFTGFVDDDRRIVGCMLHPSGSGNDGVDLRGLCHYGSMACKAFFCPAWEEVPRRYLEIAEKVVDDWHLYGLVITDVDFLNGIFGSLEDAVGKALEPALISPGPPADMLHEILRWKDSWPLKGPWTRRRSRYYFKSSNAGDSLRAPSASERIAAALDFNFGVSSDEAAAAALLNQHVQALARTWPPR